MHARRVALRGADARRARSRPRCRRLVAAAIAELAARVKRGHDDLGGRTLLLLVLLDRDTAAIVRDRDAVVGMQGDADRVAVTRDRLVDGVVDDLVDEVMEAAGPGRSDVHPRAPADGLEALEDSDVLGAVAVA